MRARRILVTAGPFFGHVNPVLPLALAAQRAGHEVVVATGPDFVEHVARVGLEAWPVGPTSSEAGTPRSLADFWHTGSRRAVDLLPRTTTWRPDLVVSDELEFAGPIVAARRRAGSVVHGLGIDTTGDWEPYAEDIDELGRQWGVPDLAARYRTAAYVSICPPTLRSPIRPLRRVMSMRPSLAEAAVGEQLSQAVAALPYEKTVHLTLGTVFHKRRPGVLEAAIAGLQELPLNLVVTAGPDVDPTRFGPQPPQVLIAPYLPHALLLPHCTLVVSQGGAGIMLGALAHGLPQLVLPQGADQFGNAAAVRRAGLGLVLEGNEVTSTAIADAVNRLLRDPGYRSAAQAVRAEIAAMPSADRLLASLALQPPVKNAEPSASRAGQQPTIDTVAP